MPVDLIIRNGRVIDPAQGIDAVLDVAIAEGTIAALEPAMVNESGAEELALTGQLVTPGLIDLHAHVASDLVSLAVEPDRAGVEAGVTTVADAGSTGYLNFPAFRKFVIAPAQTDVFVFLHVAPFGEAILPEVAYDHSDVDAILKVIQEHRDMVRGVKVRAVKELLAGTGIDVLDMARRIAREAGLPLMVHVGTEDDEAHPEEAITSLTTRVLGMLDREDVITHAYTDKPGGIFHPDGTPVDGLEAALARGVLLDAAPGRGHLNFELARVALERGYPPAALGTDVVKLDDQPHFYHVAAVASKFMALGLSLHDAVKALTINPARILGIEDRAGSLKVGMPADLTITSFHGGEFMYHDGRAGHTIRGAVNLAPQFVIKHLMQREMEKMKQRQAH